jgi:hypothetical protein
MEEYRKMSDEELQTEAHDLDQMIYVIECYGVSDLRRLSAVCNELNRRGFEPVQVRSEVEWVRKVEVE